MNSSSYTTYNSIDGFSYGIGIGIGTFILIASIVLATYLCTKNNPAPPSLLPPSDNQSAGLEGCVIHVGIDEATLNGYPKMLYSEDHKVIIDEQKDRYSTSETCCPICLADYKNSDMIRVLPGCSHLFHLKCVDPWLRRHTTCPVCRKSLPAG